MKTKWLVSSVVLLCVLCVNAQECETLEHPLSITFSGFVQKTLPGKFSVSPTKQVTFSQGNLMYQPSDCVWAFHENQYDCIGSAGGNIIKGDYNRSISTEWIDLFAFGTQGYNAGQAKYQPWIATGDDADYKHSGHDGTYDFNEGGSCYGWYSDHAEPTLDISKTESDWGWHNRIVNGGNAVHTWRLLNNEEWSYLLGGRTGAANKKSFAKIDEIRGLVLLPDAFVFPDSYPESSWKVECSSFEDESKINVFTLAQWADMESKGAVFLPCAGGFADKYPTSFTENRNGSYWSSIYFNVDYYTCSCYGGSERCVKDHNSNGVSCLKFGVSTVVGITNFASLSAARSVRVVKDCE